MDDTVSGLLVPDGDDAIEFGKRKGIQQECIDGAEDGSVSADTEGEGDDGADGEARPSQEISYCVPDVAYKTLHARLLSLPIANCRFFDCNVAHRAGVLKSAMALTHW